MVNAVLILFLLFLMQIVSNSDFERLHGPSIRDLYCPTSNGKASHRLGFYYCFSTKDLRLSPSA